MLPGIGAPAQAREVEALRIAEVVPQLHNEGVRHVTQAKDRDVLTPALRTAGARGVLGVGLRESQPNDQDFMVPVELVTKLSIKLWRRQAVRSQMNLVELPQLF